MTLSPEQQVAAHIRAMFGHFAQHRPDEAEASLHPDRTVWDVFTRPTRHRPRRAAG
jgi:hypothetical protein